MTSNTLETATPSQSELERAHLYLEQTKTGIVGAIRNLSEAQWRFQPGADRWSVAEIVEHVLFVQELVLGPVREKLANAPDAPLHPDYQRLDDMIIYQFPNRLTKFPTPMKVAGGVALSEALDRMAANYGRLAEQLATPGLRSRVVDSPPLKAISGGAYTSMDGYQWILAAAAHTERHTKQILEVMADAAFPG